MSAIDKYNALAQQNTGPQQQNWQKLFDQPAKQKGKGGPLSAWLSELGGMGGAAAGAAIGTGFLPGIGTLAGAILGGFGGGTAGRGIENKVRDDQNFFGAGGSAKTSLIEGIISGASSGLGEGLAIAKAGKAVTGEKGILKNFVAGADAKAASRLTKASQGLTKYGTGALDVKEGFRALPNAEARLATIEKYGIGSGQKGLADGTRVMGELEAKLQPILKKTKIPVTDANTILDDIFQTTSADVAEPTLKRTIASQRKALANATKDGVISGDELRTIRSKLGNGIFSGSETASKDLKKEIYRGYGDLIGSKAKDARAILGEQHNILDLEQGLAKKAEGIRIPLAGTGFKSAAGGRLVDKGVDAAAKVTGAAGSFTDNAIIRNFMRQAPGNIAGAMTGMTAPPDEADTAGVADAVAGGLADPTVQSNNQLTQLQDAIDQAMQQDLASSGGKNLANIQKYYDFASKRLQATSGGAPNITKVTAQQYGLAQSGASALQQLGQMLTSNPGVLSKTATPGRGLPLVGGFISNAAGTGEYDAVGYNIADSILRLRTGAQANESEVKKLQTQMMPRAGDDAATIQRKLAQINQIFSSVLQTAGGSGGSSLEDALMQYQGAQ